MTNFWQGKNVLVTGAGGFTGYNLCLRLQQEGANVRAFFRSSGSSQNFPDSIEIFTGDLTRLEDCKNAVKNIDTVFNLAAVFRQVKGTRDELEDVHIHAAENLINAAHAEGCRRFVHTSTMGVHGHVTNGPADEESPFNPGDDYQETKVEGELRAFELAGELGLPLTTIRPCGIYGPGDTRFLKLVKPILHGKFIMLGSGNTHYHFVYIDDLVQGYLLAAEKKKAIGEAFLIGGDESPTLNELTAVIASILNVKPPRLHIPIWPVFAAGWLCEKVCKAINIEPPLHPRRVAFFTKNRHFKIDKAKTLLDYQPKTNIKEGFKQMIDWYRDNKLL